MTPIRPKIGRLRGGGHVLGYRCSSRCRHRLHASGPSRRDGEPASTEELDEFLDLLAERAPGASFHIGGRLPWREAMVGPGCSARLTDVGHFHLDCEGRYVPGLCAGISLLFEELPGDVDLDGRPALRALFEGGLPALVDSARGRGFVPDATYGSACDLCGHVRALLWARDGDAHPELGPPGFYEPIDAPAWGEGE